MDPKKYENYSLKRHSPGPWRYTGDSIYGKQGKFIAEFKGYTGTKDAILMAAAPELLDLLCQIKVWLEVNEMPLSPGSIAFSDDDKTLLDLLREVIAKAKGK